MNIYLNINIRKIKKNPSRKMRDAAEFDFILCYIDNLEPPPFQNEFFLGDR